MKSVVFAVAGVLSLGGVYATNNVELINWRKNAYESKTPVLGEIPPGMRLSVRWEALRDGIEDYEYFAMLAKLDPNNPLLTVPEEVSSTLTEFTARPEPIKVHRRKVAKEIERLEGLKK